MKYSIIIPTYNHCDDLLKPCIESILQYTIMDNVEIIVVANGCTDNTKEYLANLDGQFNLKTIWSDDALGYPKAVNEGIKVIHNLSEYVIPFNNDALLLIQDKNQWIDLLEAPMNDSTVGVTGPLKSPSNETGRDFIIFFCAMIRRTALDRTGLLDEIFTTGAGEDTDYCMRLEANGYLVVETGACVLDHKRKLNKGVFPIYHEGEKTVHDTELVKNWAEVFKKNTNILADRYKSLKLITNTDSVAIITPTYNDYAHVIQAIKGVANQTHKNYTHFICDDGSNEDVTSKILEYVNNHNIDDSIILTFLNENKGQSYTRNTLLHEITDGLPRDKFKYVAFLDSDDYWTPTHLENSLRGLNKLNVDMVYSTPSFINENGESVVPYNIPIDQKITPDNILKQNSIHISSVVIKTDCVKEIGEFDSELDSIEDWDYWIRVINAGYKVSKLDGPTITYLVKDTGEAGKVTKEKMTKIKNKHMSKTNQPIKLNLGCGDDILDGYINCDIDGDKADMFFDATKIPFPDNSVDEIRAYHLIEHFPFQKGLDVLKEWHRALKPSGVLVMETPDLLNTCRQFVESDEYDRIKLYGHFFAWPDLSPFQTHYFLFTETQMKWSLEETGFTDIQRVKPDSMYYKSKPHWESLYFKVTAKKAAQQPIKERKVYDGFLFYNELDLLELRLNELNDVVDKFVLVESNVTFTGKPKPYYYEENKEKFSKFADKIIHIKVDDSPVTDNPWNTEEYQRNAIYRGLTNCQPEDIIIISDVDEIPKVKAIENYDPSNGISILQQKTSYYYFNCVTNFLWWNVKIGPWSEVQKISANDTRTHSNGRFVISEGGWHFTCLGGVDVILNKLNAFSHKEYNTDHFRDKANLETKIKNGWDMYERVGTLTAYEPISDDYPKYIRDNQQKYIDSGFIREIKPVTLPIDQKKYDKLKELNPSLYDEIFTQGGYMMYEEDIKDTVFVDVGANIGVTVIQALSLQAKRVLAFEPENTNLDNLHDLTGEYDNVNIYPYAVYNTARSIQVTNDGMTSNMFTVTESDQSALAVTLNEVVGLLQKDERAVLKLDCEGAEYDIIYNAPKEAVQRFESLFLEIHNDLVTEYINGGDKLIEYITDLGYTCEKLPFTSGMWYDDGTFHPTDNAFYKCKKNK